MYECGNEMVSHPKHYQSKSGLEVIDVVKAFTEDLTGIEATDTGNIIKYICRWKSKNGLEDLEKAQWYLTHLIDEVKFRDQGDSEEPIGENICDDILEIELLSLRIGSIKRLSELTLKPVLKYI